jgi:hypothetical protein
MTTKKATTKKPRARKPPAGERRDLAEMIVAVWNHPDCPDDIKAALNVGTSDLFNTLNEGERRVFKTAPYVRALLLEYKAQKGGAK